MLGLVMATVAPGLPVAATASAATPPDVPAAIAADVGWVLGQGMMGTASDGRFVPDGLVSRQSVARYL